MTIQKHGDKTRLQILNAGLECWPNVSPSQVARQAGLNSHAVVLYHFPRAELKDAIAAHAIETGHAKVIVQLIAKGHKATKKLTREEKLRYFTQTV